MAALERQAKAPIGFVASSTGPVGGQIQKQTPAEPTANPDAIDLDDDI
jgi:pre-mRNA-splicing factor SYF1